MEGTPLLDVMRGLVLDPEAQAEFAADPSGYMQRFGYDDMPEDDLREAVGLVADTLPPDVAHAVNTAAAAEPSDDSFGGGPVGVLGRISTAEVTESVVPGPGDLPHEPPDDGVVDEVVDDHDATAFGDVTRDFDDAAGEPGGGDGDDDAAGEISDGDGADPDADGTGGIVADTGVDTPADPEADVSFGHGGLDGDLTTDADPLDDVDDGGEVEAFGQGSSTAPADAMLPDDGGIDLADPADADVDDAFDTGPSYASESDRTFDDDELLGDDLDAPDDGLDPADDLGATADDFDPAADDPTPPDDLGMDDDDGGDHLGMDDGDIGIF